MDKTLDTAMGKTRGHTIVKSTGKTMAKSMGETMANHDHATHIPIYEWHGVARIIFFCVPGEVRGGL